LHLFGCLLSLLLESISVVSGFLAKGLYGLVFFFLAVVVDFFESINSGDDFFEMCFALS